MFLAAARRCLEQLAEHVDHRIGGRGKLPELIAELGTLNVLRLIAVTCAEFYEKHPHAIEMMILERAEFRDQVYPSHLMFRVENREGFDEMFREAVRKGEIRNVDPIQAHNAYSDLLFGSIVTGCLEGDRANLVNRVEKAVDFPCAPVWCLLPNQVTFRKKTKNMTIRMQRMSTFLRVVAVGAMAIAVLPLFVGCGKSPTAATEQVEHTSLKSHGRRVVQAQRVSLSPKRDFTGNLLPRRITRVTSEVDGIIQDIPRVGTRFDVELNGKRYSEQLAITIGQQVKRGDVLIQLDTHDFDIALAFPEIGRS